MQHEIAQVLEPLYRVGEEWEKLVSVYQVELGVESNPEERQRLLRRLADNFRSQADGTRWQRSSGGRRRWWRIDSEQGLDELLRLARATHQWETYVGSMAERGVPGQ